MKRGPGDGNQPNDGNFVWKGEGERPQGSEGCPWVFLPLARALEQAGKGSGAHPNNSHDPGQEKDPTGMRNHLQKCFPT